MKKLILGSLCAALVCAIELMPYSNKNEMNVDQFIAMERPFQPSRGRRLAPKKKKVKLSADQLRVKAIPPYESG